MKPVQGPHWDLLSALPRPGQVALACQPQCPQRHPFLMAKWRQKSSWPMRARRLADPGSCTTAPHIVLLTEGCSVHGFTQSVHRHDRRPEKPPCAPGPPSRQGGREAGAVLARITEGAGCPAVPVTGWSPNVPVHPLWDGHGARAQGSFQIAGRGCYTGVMGSVHWALTGNS